MAKATTTTGHRIANMIVGAQPWQPIGGTGSAQQTIAVSTGAVNSIAIPSTAEGMIITANVDISISLMSTFAATISQGYLLAALAPSPALLVPTFNNWGGAAGAESTAIKIRALTATGRANVMFIKGRGS